MRALLLTLLLAGCTDDNPSIDDMVTIGIGVYGQITTQSDIAGEPSSSYADARVTAFTSDAVVVGSTISDGHGFYQLELAPGRYELCMNDASASTIDTQATHNCAGPCTFIDVPEAHVRADWALNLSGGWWSTPDLDHCPR